MAWEKIKALIYLSLKMSNCKVTVCTSMLADCAGWFRQQLVGGGFMYGFQPIQRYFCRHTVITG